VLDDWRKEAAYSRDLRLVHDPPRVTFRTSRYMWDPALGLVQNNAYWVRGVRPASDNAYATVDLTTHGCGGSLPVVGRELPGAGPDPVPWVSQSDAVTGQTPIRRENALTGTIDGTSSLAIDAPRACLDSRRPLRLDIVTDRAVTLRFSDGRTVRLTGSGAHDTRLPSASATLAGPNGAYVSVSEDPNYKIQPDDHPEYQACLGSQEVFGSPSGSGPSQPAQGYNEIGVRQGCDESDPQTGVSGG